MTAYYLNMIGILIWVSHFMFWDFATVRCFVSSVSCNSKKASLEHVSHKVLKAKKKWPHRTFRDMMCLSRPGLFNWICQSNLHLPSPRPLCFLCLINIFCRMYVSSICNVSNILNTSNISDRLNLVRFDRVR